MGNNGHQGDIPENIGVDLYPQEFEWAVLGAILIMPEALYDVADLIDPSDFFLVRHQWIFEAMLDLMKRDQGIDFLTVGERLEAVHTSQAKTQTRLDEIGGQAYLNYLTLHCPTPYEAETYAHVVQRASIRRRADRAAQDIGKAAHDLGTDIEDVIDRVEKAAFSVTAKARPGGRPLASILRDYEQAFEQRQGQPAGISTGFVDVDGILGGYKPGNLIIIAGRPGMGKTSWLLSSAVRVARAKKRVALFSLEMDESEIAERLIAIESEVNSNSLQRGQLNDYEARQFVNASANLSQLPIEIDDTGMLNPVALRTKARKLMYNGGLDLIMVDYLQLMTAGIKTDNRVQEVTYISRMLKWLARDLKIPVLAAAQLNRAVESREDKRPVLSDLRESGSIEQDSDVVLFLYRDEMYNENTERPNQADIIVAKHRNGPTGSVPLYFRKELTKFENMTTSYVDLRGM